MPDASKTSVGIAGRTCGRVVQIFEKELVGFKK